MEHVQQALDNARQYMHDYFSDLDIDRREIEGTTAAWIHYTRRTGSHVITLDPAESAAYPAPGEVVRILFGTGDRFKVLSNTLATAQYFAEKHPDDAPRLVQYWNGRTLRTIDRTKALQIVREHHDRTRATWIAQERAATGNTHRH